MKEMINTLVEAYKEDKKEFFGSLAFMVLWAVMTWFLLWFAGTFCYDM
jgi:ABC-type multidrug transport system fused ATPase/permease subunit